MKTAGSRQKAVARKERGGALLAVLWLSAALSAIAFTLAITVRAELERASSALDAARAYYLAEGAIERFLYQLSYSTMGGAAEPAPGGFRHGQRRMRWELATGGVDLEIIGESGKLNAYATEPAILARAFAFSGVEPGRAQQIAAGIVARRQANLSAESSFSSSLPSFLQLEDLLTVSGMTPDIYYGWWDRDQGRLVERGGVSRYLTLLDGGSAVNVNYAAPAVLRAVGVPEGAIMAILEAREARVIDDAGRFGVGSLAGGMALAGGGSAAYTVRATAQLKGRPVRRTVAALIRFGRDRFEPPLGVVRWYPAAN
ncbi:MAG: hypothetical protein HY238_05215 [Acidobacteria bacterium]|nr:hypothetical protein [Acidobacteriota bacterium]